jgi:hypothetical protein
MPHANKKPPPINAIRSGVRRFLGLAAGEVECDMRPLFLPRRIAARVREKKAIRGGLANEERLEKHGMARRLVAGKRPPILLGTLGDYAGTSSSQTTGSASSGGTTTT